MKSLIVLIALLFIGYSELNAQTEFEIEPTQSMIMTGKGPGQDATINPYDGEDCYAIVKNIVERPFSVRIQDAGKIIEQITMAKGEEKRIKLPKGYQLYLDPASNGIARASVDYAKLEE